MALTDILKHPVIYQTYQNWGGFHQARLQALAKYAPLTAGDRVVDVGCGPGFIVDDLPSSVEYTGFDTDARYIAYANARFGNKGRFLCQEFDRTSAQQVGPVERVMMNGVLHHLSDEIVHKTLPAIRDALSPGGRLVTIDGCFVDGQSPVAAYLLRNDRGNFVRRQPEYEALMRPHFDEVAVHIEHHLSRLPYTFIVMVGTCHGN
jgi:SAM-dependent methyltransferase